MIFPVTLLQALRTAFWFMVSALWLNVALAAVWRVHPGESINAAVQRAVPGDTIQVERGDYLENVVIDRTLTLQGIDRPTLSGGNQGDVILQV